ncbi:MAG: hypothetical protein AAFW46_16990 [Pseudomonadota bacterium]
MVLSALRSTLLQRASRAPRRGGSALWLLAAACVAVAPAAARAQPAAATGDQVIACSVVSGFCADIMPDDCLQRSGAGSVAAAPSGSCEAPFALYRKCLQMIAEGCRAGSAVAEGGYTTPATLKGGAISCNLPRGQATTFYFDGPRWMRAEGDAQGNPVLVEPDGRLKLLNGPDFFYLLDRKTGAIAYHFEGDVLHGQCFAFE